MFLCNIHPALGKKKKVPAWFTLLFYSPAALTQAKLPLKSTEVLPEERPGKDAGLASEKVEIRKSLFVLPLFWASDQKMSAGGAEPELLDSVPAEEADVMRHCLTGDHHANALFKMASRDLIKLILMPQCDKPELRCDQASFAPNKKTHPTTKINLGAHPLSWLCDATGKTEAQRLHHLANPQGGCVKARIGVPGS